MSALQANRILRVLALTATALSIFGLAAAQAAPHPAGHAHHGMSHDMDPAEMRRAMAAWYASHPAHGGTELLGTHADTFFVSNFSFNADNNLGTQIDTARVQVGESVLFKWQAGAHTTTSGNPGDIDEGALWDHGIDNFTPGNLEFAVTFDSPGSFPFFCQPHGSFFNMKGVVRVEGTTDVPSTPRGAAIGFTRAPAPNPARSGVSFEFAMSQPGRARADVFDAAGRRVARVLDRGLEAGTHAGRWNGAGESGSRVAAGIYYLRIVTPEFDQTRRVAIER